MSEIFATEWDACWGNEESQPWYPDEQVVRFLARYVTRRLGLDANAVRHAAGSPPSGLDLGCGKGRHVLLMCELGIRSHGLDVSDVAISFASAWLKSRGFSADLRTGSMTQLPYADASLDFVVSHGVFDHALQAVREQAVAEVRRVLKPGGLFFVSVISERDSAFGHGRPVEENTWLVCRASQARRSSASTRRVAGAARCPGRRTVLRAWCSPSRRCAVSLRTR
jgi:SAM-dependent methyltransferase